MKKMLISLFLCFSAAASAFAQQPKPEDPILFRKAGHKVFAWNMGQIRQNLDTEYDKQKVLAWSKVISAITASGMERLFVPGTENDINGAVTQAKPSYFTDPNVPKLNAAFGEATQILTDAAESGDVNAINAAWKTVSKQCQSCHMEYRKDWEGRQGQR